jgi:hypothetical protein
MKIIRNNILILIVLINGLGLSCNYQPREQKILNEMTSFFEELIESEYQNSDSCFFKFINDFLNEKTFIVPEISLKKLVSINKKLNEHNLFNYFFQNYVEKDFVNNRNIPDKEFQDFKKKYKYNTVHLSDSFLDFYFTDNNSAASKYITQQIHFTGELSPFTYSRFILTRINELEYKKNKELFVVLFWPYICYSSGINFYPNTSFYDIKIRDCQWEKPDKISMKF